jgi:DNA-binding transcriptional MerR regulator
VYSIGEAARRLGLPVETLRAWHRRYGLGPAGRSEGGHRRYTDDDLVRLSRVLRLVGEGLRPSHAVRMLRQEPVDRV